MAQLSDRTCQTVQPKTIKAPDGTTRLADNWISDGGARGAGRLYLRVQPSGRRGFYFRCVTASGERQAIPLGDYKRTGPGGISLAEARDQAAGLTARLRAGVPDLKAHLAAEQAARHRAIEDANRAAKQAAADAQRGTVRALVAGYVSRLERIGTVDWKDAAGVLRLHVVEAFPELADRKAAEIKPTDLRQVLARLVDAGKGRTAGKTRSYLHAAYAAAIRADFDPDAPESLCGFGIESNPVAALPSMAHYNRAGQRTLTEAELRAYMAKLTDRPLMTRLALELNLVLAGQRPTQLVRVQAADVDVSADPGEIVLLDGKGARRQPRVHALPLTGRARELVMQALVINPSGPLLSNGDGREGKRVPISVDTLSAAVADISRQLMDEKAIRAPFTMSDVRRTCETQLAALGVSKDTRAHLLSHGLGGIQDRNYDRHHYRTEKLAALQAWEHHLERVKAGADGGGSNVVALAHRRAGS